MKQNVRKIEFWLMSAMRGDARNRSVRGSVCYLQCRVHLSPSPAPRASGFQCPCSETQQAEHSEPSEKVNHV